MELKLDMLSLKILTQNQNNDENETKSVKTYPYANSRFSLEEMLDLTTNGSFRTFRLYFALC